MDNLRGLDASHGLRSHPWRRNSLSSQSAFRHAQKAQKPSRLPQLPGSLLWLSERRPGGTTEQEYTRWSNFIRGPSRGNCLSFQAVPSSETRGTTLKETGAWRSNISEKGGWAGSQPQAVLGKLPTARWGIWALPAPPACHQRAQGLRNQAVYSASSGILQNPKDSTFWSSHRLGPSSKGVEVPRQHRGAHFSEPLWPASVLRTTGSLASNKQGQLLKVTAVGWWSPWEEWRHYTHPSCYSRI